MVGKITTKMTKKQWRSDEGIIRRNKAERGRVQSMNDGFDNLRKVVPFGEFKGKKKSKVQTLQAAIDQIRYLTNLLNSCPEHTSEIFGPFSEELTSVQSGEDSVENYSDYTGSIDGEGNSKSPNSSIAEAPKIGSISPHHYPYAGHYSTDQNSQMHSLIDGEANSKSPNSSISEVSQIGSISPTHFQHAGHYSTVQNSQMYSGYAPEYGWGYGYYPY